MRDRLARRVYPFLEPGEQIQAVVFGMSRERWWRRSLVLLAVYAAITLVFGTSSPAFVFAMLIAYGVTMFAFGDRVYRVIAATDRNIVVLAVRPLPVMEPTRILRRLPRTTPLHGPGLLNTRIDVGERIGVPFRFARDLAYANATVPPPPPPPPPPAPAPPRPA